MQNPAFRGRASKDWFEMSGLIIFVIGVAIGALSWVISPLLSGGFEPFDSGLAMVVGQIAMSAYSGYIGFRYGFAKLLVTVFGMYVGQLGYAYSFGGSEGRAWILLGAFTIMLLCVVPALTGLIGVIIRRKRGSEKVVN
jgi:hypothetical protein